MQFRMSLSMNNRYFQKEVLVDGGGSASGAKSAGKTSEPSVNEIKEKLEQIKERLGRGDSSALKELDALNIAYAKEPTENGYIVKFSYGGENYTVNYISPKQNIDNIASKLDNDKSDFVSSLAENIEANTKDYFSDKVDGLKDFSTIAGPNDTAATEEPDEVTEPEETKEPEEPDYVFDYTGVDKDADAVGYYDKNNLTDEYLNKILISSTYDMDSGGWDKLFAELEKMKPQLMDYLKQELEAIGRVYDEANAEKVINKFISQAVECIPRDGRSVAISINGPELPENPTVEDLVNYIKEQLDLTPDEEGLSGNISAILLGAFKDIVQIFPPESNASGSNSLKVNSYSEYYNEDHYLLDTADYFLTEEEKEMKFVMKVVDNDNSSYGTSDKEELFGYVDTYAKHMEKVIKHDYPNITDQQLNNLLVFMKNRIKYFDLPEPDSRGVYSIDDTLKKFEELCLKGAEEMLKES